MENPRVQCFTYKKTTELWVKRKIDFQTWMKSVLINVVFFGPMMISGKVSLNLYGKKGSKHKNEILLVIAEYIFSSEQ